MRKANGESLQNGKRRLALNRETLRRLDSRELAAAMGGLADDDGDTWCTCTVTCDCVPPQAN